VVGHRGAPKFLKFLGVDAPSSTDMNMYPTEKMLERCLKKWIEEHPGQTPPDLSNPKTLPLHRKAVIAGLNYDALLMDCKGLPIYERLKEALRWLHDVTKYEELKPSESRREEGSKVRLHSDDIKAWLEDGKIEIFKGVPRNFVHLFDILEWLKARRRGLCEPYVNDDITKEQLAGITLSTRPDVRGFLEGEEKATPVDASAYYDQFALEKKVQPYFVFEFEGVFYALKVLPMGFRPAADIAQLTSEAMLQLTNQHKALAYIDNFIFAGPTQDEDVTRFLEACKKYNLSINEAPDFKWKPELAQTVFDFLGERYNLIEQTKCSTDKTASKIERALQIINSYNPLVSARTIAAVYGILIYAASSHDLSLSDFFVSMRYLGHLGRATKDWNAPAVPVDQATLNQLREWAEFIARNLPTPINTVTDSTAHEIEIQVDASAWGWGALIINKDGTTKTLQQQWPADFDASSSSVAEPMAAWLAICATATSSTRSILLRSDHANLVFAMKRGHSHTWSYNECVRKIRHNFPSLKVISEHIAGIKNVVADKLSRNVQSNKDLEKIKDKRALGTRSFIHSSLSTSLSCKNRPSFELRR